LQLGLFSVHIRLMSDSGLYKWILTWYCEPLTPCDYCRPLCCISAILLESAHFITWYNVKTIWGTTVWSSPKCLHIYTLLFYIRFYLIMLTFYDVLRAWNVFSFYLLTYYEVGAVVSECLACLFAISILAAINCRSSGPQVGAVLKRFAPFLKLYTDYIKNFDNASSVITLWIAKSAKFMAFLDELQVCELLHLIFISL